MRFDSAGAHGRAPIASRSSSVKSGEEGLNMNTRPDRSTEAASSGVWLTTPRKRIIAAAILVAGALAFLVLWDAELLWNASE